LNKGNGRRALSHLRIIDLGWVWSGPMVSQFLADFGAEVIKIEHTKRLDSSRLRGKVIKDWKRDVEVSPYFHDLNRNKLSINLNLNSPRGLEIFKDLVRISHGLVQNFSLDVPAKLGIDYESLRKVKPDLVYLAMPTAGLSGPLKDIIGYAPVYTSLGGIESLVGYSDGTVTGMIMIGPGDPNAAIHGALAMLAALYHHERTGEGQFIELSQIEAITHLQGEAASEYSLNGRVMGPQGNQHRRMAPHGIYPCSGQDQWVSIAVDSETTWRNLCELMGKAGLADDERFLSAELRLRHRAVLDDVVSKWTRQYSKYELTTRLQAAGVAAAPVLSRQEKFSDPQLKARHDFVKVVHPVLGEESLDANPWRLSATPPEVFRPAPLVGEHNEYVYGELLNMSSAEISRLKQEEIIY
jgi:benzylsuccinate CoA-transferase BbsF subunit